MSISSIFEREEFKPYLGQWRTRITELARRKSYYNGSVYRKMRGALGWLAPRVFQKIKPLYLPLSRAVDVDAGIIPGGWALAKDAPDKWRTAMATVFEWSEWATDGVLFVHYGAQYGVSGLKIADLREAKRVVVKPVDPSRFLLVASGQYDSTPAMSLWVERRAEATGEAFEYAEVIEPERVRTYKDGAPTGFDGREPEYVNELKFVPFVEVRHIETGEALGECTFQRAIPLLDEVNKLASKLAEIVGKHAEPQWAVIGAEAGDLVKSGDNVWFIPQGGDVRPLVADIDIAGVLAFIQEIRDQVHGSLPELAFDDLRRKDQIATATLELQLMELVLKVKRTRPNYDQGLVNALRLAGRASASMGVSLAAALDDEALALDGKRAVLPLDPETAMRLEMQSLELEMQRAMMQGG